MEITEEQRKRSEANRLAALAKRKAAEATKLDPWKLFKCRKPSPESQVFPKPDKILADALPNPSNPLPEKFLVRLEICSPDSFSVTPLPLPDSLYPGETKCLQRLTSWLSFVVPSYYTQNQSGGTTCVYKLRDYDMVLKCLKKYKGIELQDIPWRTLSVVDKFSHSSSADHWIPCTPEHLSDDDANALLKKLPKNLLEALLPFQLDGVKFGLRRGGCCLIADEMGLGKTIQAIAIACCFMNEGPILVVCPAILRFTWAEELEHWLPICSPMDIHLVFGHKNNPSRLTRCPRVVVISYTMLHHLRESMLDQEWAVLIVDESHHMRCTKKILEPNEIRAVLDVATKVKHKVLLSGTPSLSRPGLLGNDKYEFAKNYCEPKLLHGFQGKIFKDFSNGIRLEELNILLKQTIMIRRLKEHVLVQLPPKRRQIIRLKLKRSDILFAIDAARVCNIGCKGTHQEIKPATNQCTTENEADEDGLPEPFKECHDTSHCDRTSRQLSHQELGIAKLSGFHEWLSIHPIVTESECSENFNTSLSSHKMIIFAHHLKVLDGIQEFACEKGIGFVRIDGSTLARDRQSAVQAFRTFAEIKIAIIGITAGGVGIDFSSAQNVVFLELPHSASEMLQAEDRVHRRGQTNAVNIYIFCAKDTSDESHWHSLNKSLHRVSSVMNGKYDAVKEIEVERVSDLVVERKFSEYENSVHETENSKNGASGLNALSKTDNSTSEDGLLESAVLDELSVAVTTNSEGIGANLKMKPAETFDVLSENIGSNVQVETDTINTTQTDCLHFKASRASSVEMVEHSVSGRSLEDYASGALEIGSPDRVLKNKLDKAQKMFNVACEGVESGNVGQTEADTSSFIPADSLRFEVNSVKVHSSRDLQSLVSRHLVPLEFHLTRASLGVGVPLLVSQYTGRIHLYTCIPGKDSRPRPLFENFHPDELESLNFSTSIVIEKKDEKCIRENPIYKDVLLEFIKEWNNLRPIQQKKLLGKPLQCPLYFELCVLNKSINHGSQGLLNGGSNRRTTPLDEISHPLPAKAIRKRVSVCSGRGKKEKKYTQGWTMTGEPLCILCQTPCKGKLAKSPEYFEDLFCNLDCYNEYRMRTNQRSLRQELFKTEHGVCKVCNLDCHKLVKCIRPLPVAKRRKYIEMVAPKLASHKKLLDRLVNEPKAGNAWHADHIVPVQRGGGECNLDNMRTLCVACHSEVTAVQCTEQCKARKQLKVIMRSLKDADKTEQINSNLKDDSEHLEMGENTIVDELLLVKVPGSAYSSGKTPTTETDEQKSNERREKDEQKSSSKAE